MRIFISYRRDDSAGYAGRLYDRLKDRFGAGSVFMDIDAIPPGADFVEVINKAVGACDALVALIGRQWLTIADDEGRRRLENPHDYTRLEIAAALARKVRVIPALVQGAAMPHAADLPDDLTPLARRQAVELSDTRFHGDVDRLIAAIETAARPASLPGGRTPFLRRWWRVPVCLAAGVFVLLALLDLYHSNVNDVLLAVVGLEHLLRRRWLRAALFFLLPLVSAALFVVVTPVPVEILYASYFLVIAVAFLWSLADAIRFQAV